MFVKMGKEKEEALLLESCSPSEGRGGGHWDAGGIPPGLQRKRETRFTVTVGSAFGGKCERDPNRVLVSV